MINVEKSDKADIITFTIDKINALITEDIREEISQLYENANSKVVINLQGINYIDSSGFGCFLSIMKTARNNYGVLKFVNPEPSVMEVFKTLHLDTIFEIYDNIDTCLESFI